MACADPYEFRRFIYEAFEEPAGALDQKTLLVLVADALLAGHALLSLTLGNGFERDS
jgi:hypothetical protein